MPILPTMPKLFSPNHRRRWLALAIAIIAAAGAVWATSAPHKPHARRPHPYDQPGAAAAYFAAQRAPIGSDEVPVERYAAALAQRAAMLSTPGAVRAKVGRTVWQPAGPEGVGGRTRGLVIDPVETQVMYAAGVSGGVWKSIDAGANWRSTGDVFASLATVTLVMDPADRNTLFAGTGEGFYVNRPVTRSRGVRGDGIFVSSDGARNWRQLASTHDNPDFDYVNELAFDGSGRLYAATRTGVWVSADRGEHWTHTLTVDNVEGCSDLAWSAAGTRMLVSCGWFSVGALYASVDGGANWTQSFTAAAMGRTNLAVAPSNTNVVYGLTANFSDYGFERLLRSDNGGASWRVQLTRSTADLVSQLLLSNPLATVNDRCDGLEAGLAGQGWYDNALAVDPVNPEIVWAGGIDLFRSDDGGRHFGLASRWWIEPGSANFVHADQHAIVFDPRYNGTTNRTMYVGDDGGIFRTDQARGATSSSICGQTGGLSWTRLNSGYRVTQFYHGAVSTDGTVLTGGAQDNGTTLGSVDPAQPWRAILGGDGAYTQIDPRTSQRIYASYQFGAFQRSEDFGNNFTEITTGLPTSSSSYPFIAPLILDTNAPDILWAGAGSRLYRSLNRGTQWSAASPAGVDARGGLVNALAIAPGASNRIVAGFNTGTVVRSSDNGASWEAAVPRDGVVSSLTFDPTDINVVYATYSTFGGAHLWRSDDGGANWIALDGTEPRYSLPDVPAHVLMVDPRDRTRLWLGTDIGLFIGLNGGARWYADASGIGNALIEHLVLAGSGAERELVAFTYGRGAYRARLADLGPIAVNPGLSGLWFEAATSGQGFQFDVNPGDGQIVAGWYTHLPAGTPATRSKHVWLIGNASLVDNVAQITMYRSRGGKFDQTYASVIDPVGQLEVRFDDCSVAHATYDITLDGTRLQGEIPLARLTPDILCSNFRRLGDGALGLLADADAHAGDFEYGHGGTWFDPATAGQGMLFEVDSTHRLMQVSWYTYDPTDVRGDATQSPTWYLAQGTVSGANADLVVYRTVGGVFDRGDPTTTAAVGTLRLTAQSCNAVRADYALTLPGDGARNGSIGLSRLTPPVICEAAAP